MTVGSGELEPKQQFILSWTPCGTESLMEPEGNTNAEVIDVMEPAAFVELPQVASAALMVLRMPCIACAQCTSWHSRRSKSSTSCSKAS